MASVEHVTKPYTQQFFYSRTPSPRYKPNSKDTTYMYMYITRTRMRTDVTAIERATDLREVVGRHEGEAVDAHLMNTVDGLQHATHPLEALQAAVTQPSPVTAYTLTIRMS